MKIFLSTCLIFIILSGVTAERCKAFNPSESKKEGFCDTTEGGSCYYHRTSSNINAPNEARITEHVMGCTTDCTTEEYSFTINATRFLESKRKCCNGTGCLSALFNTRNRTLNGKECPGCFPAFSNACKGKKKIKCYNHETRCIEFLLVLNDKARTTKNYYGCAAPKFCEAAKTGKHKFALEGNITKAICCDTLP